MTADTFGRGDRVVAVMGPPWLIGEQWTVTTGHSADVLFGKLTRWGAAARRLPCIALGGGEWVHMYPVHMYPTAWLRLVETAGERAARALAAAGKLTDVHHIASAMRHQSVGRVVIDRRVSWRRKLDRLRATVRGLEVAP